MRALSVVEPKIPLKTIDLEIPIPKENEILLHISTCGVCRTDLHIKDGDIIPPHYPIISGHQIVGKVSAKGSKVTQFQVGDRVGVPWLGGCCFHCYYCLHSQENLCDTPTFTGFNRNGGFAEYCTANELFCYHLPENYSDVEAAPLLCAGLIGFRSLRLCGNVQKIGLLGFGASAHIVAQVCKHQGKEVYAFTRKDDNEKQAFARTLGATWVGSIDTPPQEHLDAVIIFASDGSLVPQALSLLRKGGVVVCAGIHMSNIPSFPYADLWNEKMIRSVANLTRQDAIDFLDFAAKHPLKIETTLYDLSQADQALEDLRHGKFNGSAVLKCS